MRRLIPLAEAALSWGTPPAELYPAENVANPLVDSNPAGRRGNRPSFAAFPYLRVRSEEIPALCKSRRGAFGFLLGRCSLVGLAGCFVARFDRL